MSADLDLCYRKLDYLREWIEISIRNHLDRLLFEEVWKRCGIMIEKAPRPENCIYDDFEGYCACREEEREK